MKKILLVKPSISSEIAPHEANVRLPFGDKRALMPTLQLAILAALTPDDIEVDIWDEVVHGRIDEGTDLKDYDLVGITGFTAHFFDAKRLARFFSKRGIPVVVGGSGVSAAPERYRNDFDVLFIGEAEYTWGQFISDWKAGSYRKEYRQITKPDMADSPLPRWDSIEKDMKYYITGPVQTTRGCPFNCEFCDVIFLYGHRVRQKPIERVIEEVCALERLGFNSIFFCDDNFAGNPRYVKDLLRELIPVNNSFAKPLFYETQISLNVAKDEELLELMADANFRGLFIGIESPNKESLKEVKKFQNYKTDMLEDIHKILSYGLTVRAGIMVGFDHDDKGIFDWQFEFIQEACIPYQVIYMLDAPVGTKIWWRLLKEGRLIKWEDLDAAAKYGRIRTQTNIIPKQMTRVELMSGYKQLLERVDDWDNFAKRVKGFVSMVKRRPNVTYKQVPEEQARLILQRLLNAIEDEKTKNVIFDILSYTRQQAPFMLRKVLSIVLEKCINIPGLENSSEPFRAAIDEQLALEKSIHSLEPYIDKSPIFVSDEFRDAYRKVFPQIYQRLFDGLVDKSLLPETLVEVFTDFLIRFGDTFDLSAREQVGEMEEHHLVALQEIANRTIAKKNQTHKEEILHPGEKFFGERKMNELRVEVLKHVEINLREFYYSRLLDDSSVCTS